MSKYFEARVPNMDQTTTKRAKTPAGCSKPNPPCLLTSAGLQPARILSQRCGFGLADELHPSKSHNDLPRAELLMLCTVTDLAVHQHISLARQLVSDGAHRSVWADSVHERKAGDLRLLRQPVAARWSSDSAEKGHAPSSAFISSDDGKQGK